MDTNIHRQYTGVDNNIILKNLQTLLENGYNLQVRVPLLRNVNENEKNINDMASFLEPFKDKDNFKGVSLLPYHKMSLGKYRSLGMQYELSDNHSIDEPELVYIESCLNKKGIKTTTVRH